MRTNRPRTISAPLGARKGVQVAGAPHGHDHLPAELLAQVGDVVLRRKDQGAAYHLAVVIDDDAQNITDVVRGADLTAATQIHVVFQHLLNIQTPRYHHHALIRDETGKRLAKRSDSEALTTLRNAGYSAQDITERLFSAV